MANANAAQSSGDADLQDEPERLSFGDRNDAASILTYKRTSEYEDALSPTPPKKQGGGPRFKIIKGKADHKEGPQLDTFPNGMCNSVVAQEFCD